MTVVDAVGLVGATALALSALPQAVQSWRQGHSDGVSWGLLASWLAGEACLLVYVFGRPDPDWLLVVNYAANLVLVGVVARFRLRK